MKMLSIFTGTLLWCITATAGVHSTTAPQDSTLTRCEIKKVDLKQAHEIKAIDASTTTPPKAKEVKLDEKRPTANIKKTEDDAPKKLDAGTVKKLEVAPPKKQEDGSTRKPEADAPNNLLAKPEQIAGSGIKVGSKASAEEIKEVAKREKENRKPEKQPERPSVSYPYYPGGNIAVREFVRKNIHYPEECKRERLTGRVEVLIAIAPDGTPHSATISKSSGNVHMDAEALRIAELMPKWQPAEESDDPQELDYVIYVNFRPGR